MKHRWNLVLVGLTALVAAASTSSGLALNAPTNVVARVLPAEIVFTWDPVPGADYYQVLRGGPDKRWVPLPTTTNTVCHEGDFTVLPSFYQILAYTAGGELLSYTPDMLIEERGNPLTFIHHVVRPVSDTSAAISWAISGAQADGILEVGSGTAEPFFVAINPAFQSTHEFVVTNLVAGTTYWFRMTSADENRGGTIYRNTFTHRSFTPAATITAELTPGGINSYYARGDIVVPIHFTAPIMGENLQFSLIQPPVFGRLEGNWPTLTYTPGISANIFSVDEFLIGISDGNSVYESRVGLVVEFPGSGPILRDQSVTLSEDTLSEFILDSFLPGENMQIIAGPTNGLYLPVNTLPFVRYGPNTNFYGIDHFQFTASELGRTGNLAVIRLRVAPVPDAPIAPPQFITLLQDTGTNFLLAFSDPDGRRFPLNLEFLTAPAHGVLTGGYYSDYRYVPNPGYHGTDSFSYVVRDELWLSATGTVHFTILRTNLAPVANSVSFTTEYETPVDVTLSGSDVDGDPLLYELVDLPAYGTLSGAAPNLTYQPGTNFIGNDTLSFRVNDGRAVSTPATVILSVLPPAPPSPPSGLSAIAVSRTQVDLTWTDNSRDEDGFQIERANDNKPWKLLATVGRDVRTFVDIGLMKNKTYSYRVRSVNRFGASSFTPAVTVTTPR